MPTSITKTAISLRVRSPSFKVSSEWCSDENADFARRGNIADRCEPHREQAAQIRQRIQSVDEDGILAVLTEAMSDGEADELSNFACRN
jgi:hypothetical protein